MGQLVCLPTQETAFARLTDRQRQANIIEERMEHLANARDVLRKPGKHTDQVLRDACSVLETWGDGNDYLTADAMIYAINRREWLARNHPKPQYRWQDVLAGAVAFVAVAWVVLWVVLWVVMSGFAGWF